MLGTVTTAGGSIVANIVKDSVDSTARVTAYSAGTGDAAAADAALTLGI